MKKKLRFLLLPTVAIVVSLFNFPLAFARRGENGPVAKTEPESAITGAELKGAGWISNAVSFLYDSLDLEAAGLNRQAFDFALAGWNHLVDANKLQHPDILAIADFTQPSNKKRLFVLDLRHARLLYQTLVAHGRNSGKLWATTFSNKLSSYKSSPGFYVTGATYTGSNGYSLKLTGVEAGINDKALKRAIVMHGADYVDESTISSLGYLGRSQGCPAVPVKEARNIINTLKDGACLYIHTADKNYVSRSSLLSDSSGS
jgi:hypothetical protein